ncbi:TOMM precursor leader peptide-binding protein [Streptomyces sp. CA-249302]|uniref:TOMM precursor leader peptide-binding protein n=1 Tax=Streptomyces sp. CA-249302 TaxID=3240058 RepID=UPI003D905360
MTAAVRPGTRPYLGFKPHLRVEAVPGEAAYLISERRVTALHGTAISHLAPLLDGTRDLGALRAACADRIPDDQVERLVAGLDRAGLLHRAGARPADPGRRAQEAYWELAGLEATAAADRLATSTVRVLGVGPGDDGPLRTALTAAGLVLAPDGTPATLTLVLCDDYLNPELARVDEEFRAANTPWLPVRTAGRELWVGPFFGVPASTPGATHTARPAGTHTDSLDGTPSGNSAAQGAAPAPPVGLCAAGTHTESLEGTPSGSSAAQSAALPSPVGPCWSCLADRLWRGRQAEAHVQRLLGRPGPAPRPGCSLPAARLAGLQLAVLEAAKWLGGHRDAHQAALWTLDTLTLQGTHHPVDRRPQCASCGDPGLVTRRVRRPVVLEPRPKRDVSGGGHRSLSPQEMLARHGRLVDPLTGLVAEIRRDPRGPEALNCFHAGHNPVAGPSGLDALRAGLRHTSSGKGVTALHARVSALGEALERHSGFLQGDEPVRRGRYADLAPEAVHPDAVQLFHPRQFRDRDRWNAGHAAVHRVCDPFDERAETDWTPVWSLTGQRRRLLPTAYLYYNAPQAPGRTYCWAHSNGTAAGATLEDAVLQGTLELIERDAVALWWYNRTRQPGIDLTTATDPYVGQVAELHRRLGREIWALDLTSDLGVPVVAALSRRTDRPAGRGQDIVLGFGAHLDPGVALRRALTELNQMLPPVVEATADGTGYGCSDPYALDWFRTAAYEDLPYLRPRADAPVVTDRPAPTDDVTADVALLEGRLAARGLELMVLDQTRPDVGLAVARVIVPGLRPHWARLAPGRLYEVPVRLGRLAAPLSYEQLNPVPLFL